MVASDLSPVPCQQTPGVPSGPVIVKRAEGDKDQINMNRRRSGLSASFGDLGKQIRASTEKMKSVFSDIFFKW